ncbi:FAD-binding oxidoreductase [Dasania sp. GY-MA-18]|uniref:FAD-binding oxidoreductase n=1 Tax=Dasania phycosphaerae TaxID=2950436 RepID=A0A9J6RM84_9GAMM|nr:MULTISPECIES: FAD-binding oxidoreductase [Dasania]MCR8922864.1 FAD-binding oxidoreductase [Dasania sp. GY-MA-18]MCZ0865295.1 FAD-binding oxidoreductase [Dasania phycosphaerae]MCZ0869020.1 FAD-binding oxidoreductase [Dasania phycosphaerae]
MTGERKGYIDSYYTATANNHSPYPQLAQDIRCDVCIIGGGYSGLSTALHLAKKGLQVVLLEAERVGWGASGRNGGHVGTGQRKGQQELESMLGKDRAKTLWQYSLEAVQTVEGLINDYNIACDLKTGNAHVTTKAKEADDYKQSVEHMQRVYGYEQIRYLDKDELSELFGNDKFQAGEINEGGRHLHPLNFALGLAQAAQQEGVKIYEYSRVNSYSKASPCKINTEQATVTADHMVVACNGYLEKLEPKVAGKIMPINNFMLATEPLPEDLARKINRDDVSVSDSLFVINYWKLSGDNRLLWGGGENYTRRFPRDIKNFVRQYMLRHYPELKDLRIDYGWGGTLAVTLNRMPHFQRLENNCYVIQGYSGHGVPTSVFAGKVLAEAIAGDAGRFDTFAQIPSPTFPGGTLLRWPGLVAGMLYYSLLDRL